MSTTGGGRAGWAAAADRNEVNERGTEKPVPVVR
jgi:hypothetical protein